MSDWKELTNEIMLDVAKFVAATPDITYIVGIVQWNGKFVARPIYQPSPVELVGGMHRLGEEPMNFSWQRVLVRVAILTTVIFLLRCFFGGER